MNDNVRKINNAMSLRKPQLESLQILSDIVANIELSKTPDLGKDLAKIRAMVADNEPMLEISDFERDFPSVCFSVATGVGKTRLMGAFITYLHLERGIKNFFIIAPNLTIYNKLIADFRDISNPKYVFNGVPEFAVKRPIVITGDDYTTRGGFTTRIEDEYVKINIFNAGKIFKTKGASEFRSFRETIGSSYFDYLKSLPDLVVLMDEAHRYHADAGMKTINELGAVLGLEVTATAKTTGERAKNFRNIIYHYSLAQAINDRYVKKPAIVGRTNFDKAAYDDAGLEEIKLTDGFRVHEDTYAELTVYAAEHNERFVKPFLLIIARDTAHADELKAKLDSDDWMDGKYKNKVIVVHSNQTGAEKDENIDQLLQVEKADNPIEVVIHVNMLAEGWDVNNLYTIIPLKAARTDILVEQSIGRGLRLPYGKYTGVDNIDRLNIVAHDKFAEIVKLAEDEKFAFQQVVLNSENDAGNKVAVDNPSGFLNDILTGGIQVTNPENRAQTLNLKPANAAEVELFTKVNEQIEEKVKTIGALDEIKSVTAVNEIVTAITETSDGQGQLAFVEDTQRVKEVVQKMTERYVEMQIKIPPIRIVRAAPQIGIQYGRFDLDLTPFDNLKPIQQKILVQDLLGNKKEEQGDAKFTKLYDRPQDYIIIKLMDHLPCTTAEDIDLLDFFAGQVVNRVATYVTTEEEILKILFFNSERIARDIATQADGHKIVPPIETKVKGMDDGYACLRTRPAKLLGDLELGEMSFRTKPKDLKKIRSIVFINFQKALSSKAKFDSDTERQLALLLEDTPNVVRWERLTDDQGRDAFNMRYKKEGKGLMAYCPDFVVETDTAKYIVETKAVDDMTAADVIAKSEIAKRWCAEATKYETANRGKPWSYLLVPHNDLDPTRTFEQLAADWGAR